MKSFKQFFVEQNKPIKSIVFAYGRFNPPTIGHEVVIKKVINTAAKMNAEYAIIPSHGTTPKYKNPLSLQEKIGLLQYMVSDPSKVKDFGTTFIDVLKKFYQMGYTHVIQIAGSDRKPEFLALVNKYNGKPDPTTGNVDFNFNTFEVISSGERDPDSEDVEGMSASKLRALAVKGDFDNFSQGMSPKIPKPLKKTIFNIIRKKLIKQ